MMNSVNLGESKPDIGELKKFASRVLTKDRGGSPFFSGRRQEIADIELSIEGVMARLRSGATMPASDETWLFQGPPGVGKSALLARLEERWSASQKDANPIALPIRADLVLNQANLVAKIADAVAIANSDAAASDKLRQIISIDRGSTTSVGGEFFIKASTQSIEGTSIITNPRELTWDTLVKFFPKKEWKRPIVLLLDEVQTLNPQKESSEISNLHQGIHGLPIIPIFAGLSNSFDVLLEQGISRMSHSRRVTLGSLERNEAAEAVKLMLSAFGIAGSNHADWAYMIAEDSSGWPQHIQTGLQALARVLVDNDGVLGSTKGEFSNAVFELSARYRNEYYEGRLDDDLAGCIGLVHAALNAARPPGKTLAELKKEIADCARNGENYNCHLPETLDASALLNRMIKRGLLQVSQTGRRYTCPIPSLGNYISDLAID